MKTVKAFTVLLLSLLCHIARAQRSDRPVSTEEQKEIIRKALAILKEQYIFPAKVDGMEKALWKNYSGGKYSAFTTVEDFLKDLNTDLETISNDPHIDIFFDPVRVKQIEAEAKGSSLKRNDDPRFLQRAKYENYRMRKAERMDGNVGYLNFLSFMDTALSKKTMVAAMNFIGNSNALIIDLRQNGGGDAAAVSFLLNYFLPDSTLIMQARGRKNEIINSYTANDALINKIDTRIPVYILTSKRTSSAAEAFAYTLRSYKRAILVGDTTHGEANPGYLFALNSEMYIMIPAFENTSPVTGTNWQGTGVYPDVFTRPEKALSLAYAMACDSLSKLITDDELKYMYSWMADGLYAELKPVTVKEEEWKALAGDYADNRHIVFSESNSFYFRGDDSRTKKKLAPIKKDLYSVEGISYFRIKAIRNPDGEIIAIEGRYDDGKVERSARL